ncbi:MAG: DUF4386 domain-containing protein [Legionellales bacterium]
MNPNRKTARIAGVLFIIATAASILSLPFLNSIKSSNYLVDISANRNQMGVGVLLAFVAAFASASIAISMYPILRKHNHGLALTAVGFRLIEGVFYLVGIVCLLTLTTLSQEFVKAGATNQSYFQTLGTILLAAYNWAGNVASVLAFCLGAFMYYYLFFQTNLIPRWLSGWGILGVAMLIVAIILVVFGVTSPLGTVQVVSALPIAIQEMVLAVWLLVRGFNSSATTSVN